MWGLFQHGRGMSLKAKFRDLKIKFAFDECCGQLQSSVYSKILRMTWSLVGVLSLTPTKPKECIRQAKTSLFLRAGRCEEKERQEDSLCCLDSLAVYLLHNSPGSQAGDALLPITYGTFKICTRSTSRKITTCQNNNLKVKDQRIQIPSEIELLGRFMISGTKKLEEHFSGVHTHTI